VVEAEVVYPIDSNKRPEEVVYENYYVQFYIRQQKNFENCLIENEIVVRPEKLITLSDTRIIDLRQFVYD
jgi:hypothetical protein